MGQSCCKRFTSPPCRLFFKTFFKENPFLGAVSFHAVNIIDHLCYKDNTTLFRLSAWKLHKGILRIA